MDSLDGDLHALGADDDVDLDLRVLKVDIVTAAGSWASTTTVGEHGSAEVLDLSLAGGGHYVELMRPLQLVAAVWIPELADWLPFYSTHVTPFLRAHANIQTAEQLRLLTELEKRFDVVILDSGPVDVSGTLILGGLVEKRSSSSVGGQRRTPKSPSRCFTSGSTGQRSRALSSIVDDA